MLKWLIGRNHHYTDKLPRKGHYLEREIMENHPYIPDLITGRHMGIGLHIAGQQIETDLHMGNLIKEEILDKPEMALL